MTATKKAALLASLAIVGVVVVRAWPAQAGQLRADNSAMLADSDGDFLPDVVEWAVLTNPLVRDTDRDNASDFVEVVQRGIPRRVGIARATDHESRIVVTSTPAGNGENEVWLHLLFRFLGDVSLLTTFQPWIEVGAMPGVQFPLTSLTNGTVIFNQHLEPNEGLWIHVAVPLASENVLRTVLPCTIAADTVIGGRPIRTGVRLFDLVGTTATLVPFDATRFAVQSIAMTQPFGGGGSNRVCVLTLEDAGAGPGGVAYEVTDADCDDCNDLECGANCTDTVGWVIFLPGGVETITGG